MNDNLIIIETWFLLTHYGFEISGYTVEELLETWLINYEKLWLKLAIIEALYQGRYKAVSVEQILSFWHKKGNPTYHFTKEFERLICHNVQEFIKSFYQDNQESSPEEITVSTTENDPPSAQEEKNLEEDEIELLKSNKPEQEQELIAQTEEESNSIILRDYSFLEEIIYEGFTSQPIEQFIPPLDSSQFFLRLKEFIEY